MSLSIRAYAQMLDGMKLADAAQALGLTPSQTRAWLNSNGMRVGDNVVRAARHPHETADAIAARIAAAPPTAPCFRCGARAACEHRSN